MNFSGLAAFPFTPFNEGVLDLVAFEKIIVRLLDSGVDSICALGSTGLYPYLNEHEYRHITRKTVELSGDTPVMVGIGALTTRDVLVKAETAQKAGVDALLLAPVSYHRLHDEEVYSLYETVCRQLSVPLCIYENPGVTGFEFSDELYKSLSALPNIAAIKIPGSPFADEKGHQRIKTLRALLPQNMAIGVSGDKFGVAGLAAGCDLWLSVLGGLFPHTVKTWITMIRDGHAQTAEAESERFSPMWDLFVKSKGGLRVMATAASILGISEEQNLPAPLKPLNVQDREVLQSFMLAHGLI
ncbi:dihydrodipicolinate synthase family protein [Aestuariibacter salexigens]|uniref:dihydrodipicolinate synthase family protein n=1 Tax=Aestuariibacter salexigens TaxID=226010 RepID=UPI0004055205|nr:dihydrodipicolinate synthase family protein [Aestuariibacter salexigens]